MSKQELRKLFLQVRQQLSPSRKQEAARLLVETLLPYCKDFERIASFCSTGSEIETNDLNQALAQAGRLALPRCQDEELCYYVVDDLSALQLKAKFLEPDPSRCEKIELNRRDLILVPGLAFDDEHFRLGYGQGHFDRFLTDHPLIPTAGLAFLEQKSQTLLPRDPWDRPVERLFLF